LLIVFVHHDFIQKKDLWIISQLVLSELFY